MLLVDVTGVAIPEGLGNVLKDIADYGNEKCRKEEDAEEGGNETECVMCSGPAETAGIKKQGDKLLPTQGSVPKEEDDNTPKDQIDDQDESDKP